MSVATALLAWYDRNRRDLPWRGTADPYRIWVSEVMLQQTRVETVLPYYRRFLERFPTVDSLAAAQVEELLVVWSGLGYYRRARQMHAAARRIVDAGGFPQTIAGLKALPGIGDYTAAAVASMAFGVAAPVLDGNVERVLSRLGAVAGDPRRREVRRRLATAAEALLDPRRPGDANQALMELGALVCTPRNPACPVCPLTGDCRARAAGDPERFPPPRQRRPVERQRRLVAVVEEGGRLLLFRRPEGSELLAGTWELPWVELDPGVEEGSPGEGREGPEGEGRGKRKGTGERGRAARALGERYGGRWRLGPRVAVVRHGITWRDIAVEVHRCRLAAGDAVAEGPAAGWFAPAELAALPRSSLLAKVVRSLARRDRNEAGPRGGKNYQAGL